MLLAQIGLCLCAQVHEAISDEDGHAALMQLGDTFGVADGTNWGSRAVLAFDQMWQQPGHLLSDATA